MTPLSIIAVAIATSNHFGQCLLLSRPFKYFEDQDQAFTKCLQTQAETSGRRYREHEPTNILLY